MTMMELFNQKEYEKCILVAREVTRRAGDTLGLCVLCQECYLRCNNAKGVSDQFLHIRKKYGHFPQVYERVAEFLYSGERYDALQILLDEARSHGVGSNGLDYYQLMIEKHQIQKSDRQAPSTEYGEEEQKAFSRLASRVEAMIHSFRDREKQAQDMLRGSAWDLSWNSLYESGLTLSGLYLEAALCCYSSGEYERGIRDLDQGIAAGLDSRKRMIYLKSCLLLENGCYSQALTLLSDCRDEYGEVPSYYFHLGQCYAFLGNPDDAAGCFDWALSIKPDYLRARKRVVELDTERLEATGESRYSSHGLPHVERLLSAGHDSYTYQLCGRFYQAAGMSTAAANCFQKAGRPPKETPSHHK